MSKIGVLIAVIVALLLGAAAWLLLGNSPATPSTPTAEISGPLLSFRPSEVREIAIDAAGDQRQIIVRDGEAWTLRIERADGGAPDAWPVSGGQVRPLLSVLQALSPVAMARTGDLSAPAVVITLRLASGSLQTLRLGPDAVGGRRLAQANDGDLVYIDQLLVEALTSPGPRAWREMRIFPTVGAETSRIEITTHDATVSLARVRGVWRLREPVRAPADGAAVDRLLNQLASLSVDRWIDDPNAARDVAPSSPNVVRVAVERDRRIVDDQGEPGVVTDRREAIFAGAADLSGASRLLYVGEARTPAVIRSDAVAALRPAPASLISRRAVDVAASQVASMRIVVEDDSAEPRSVAVKRTLDGWSLTRDGAETAIHPSEAQAVLALLIERIADDVVIAPQDPPAPIASVELRAFDDGPLAAVTVHRADDGLILRTGEVARHYRGAPLPGLLGGETAIAGPAPDADPIK